MNNRWTDEQKEAVFSRGGNLLVSAAAGAGKTTVLVERIIRLVTDPVQPVDIDHLLVVTFTNAAAAEMRERIGRALAHEINRQPDSKHLRRQAALLGRACISTIHSFCLELLRGHFHRIDLDPAFRVADETETALIQTEALEELFEQCYAAGSGSLFTALVDSYGGKRDDTNLQEMVLSVYKLARSTSRPQQWLAQLPAHFDLPPDAVFDRLPWCGILQEALEIELAGIMVSLDAALRLSRYPGGPVVYSANLEADRETVGRLMRASRGSSWDALQHLFNGAGFGKLKSCKKEDADPKLVEQVKKLRENAKRKLAALKRQYFPRLPEELCADLRQVAPLVEELAALVQKFKEYYRKAKAARGVVDFADLEHYALQILEDEGPEGTVPSPVALELRERFAEVLVDEYQDINGVQEAVLRLVSRQGGAPKPNLFMVGDVKQSIYRFRLAEPGLFLEKYKTYPVKKGGRERRIDLTKNFRSRKGLVGAVNFVFYQLMTAAVGELEYGPGAELVYGDIYPPVPDSAGVPDEADEAVEVYLIDRANPAADTVVKSGPEHGAAEEEEASAAGPDRAEWDEDLDTAQAEARLIATRIKEMVAENSGVSTGRYIYDKNLKTRRPPAYRDVVVLMRATAGSADTFVEEFRREGVPAYAESATGYFVATEVETMLSLLNIIDNPRQDIPLAGVLRSPVVGLKGTDLARIRLAAPESDFYTAVVTAARWQNGSLSQQLAGFLKQLDNWRTAARQGSLADLIWSVYRETGYYDFVGGLPGGGQRQANLRALYHRARQYEATAFRGLFLFLRFIERIREGGRDLGTARALNEKENVVRIMSIHKSKGLEFPVVFIAGLGKKFNFKDLNKPVLYHKDLGLGPGLVDYDSRVIYPTAAKLALKHKLKMEVLAEEMRILYVAMTRAREKLILVGSTRNIPACAGRWCIAAATPARALPDGILAGAASFLDWLGPALVRHRDGAEIRKLGLVEPLPTGMIADRRSAWKVFINRIPAGGSGAVGQSTTGRFSLVGRMEPVGPPGECYPVIKNRLEWSYPFTAATVRAAKISVTEIKRKFEILSAEEALKISHTTAIAARPGFLQRERGLTAAEKGTVLHLVMQNLDLKEVGELASIKTQIAKMVETELLTPEQASSLPVEAIAAFFTGTLGRRVLAGRAVLRELPFTAPAPAPEVYPELGEPGTETIIVQGVLDCLVDEGDGYLLLDYKTGNIAPEQIDAETAGYRTQLNLYAGAVENILQKRVKEKWLHFFGPGLSKECR